MRIGWCLILYAILAPGRVAGQDDLTPLRVDDLFAIARVGNPQISPDGEWVAYTVTTTDLAAERSETGLWMIGVDGGEPLRMTAVGSSASRPRWSPDGRYLSFLGVRNGRKPQVWVLDRRGGEARALTDVRQGVGGYAWSPDGTSLVLSLRDTVPGDSSASPDAPRPPWVIDRLQFKRDNVGYLDDRHTHLYLFEVKTGALRALTAGPYDESQAVWSPDGHRIAFTSNRTAEPDGNGNTDIWVLDVDTEGAIPRHLTVNPGADGSPAWSPDGTQVAYVTMTEPALIWYAVTQLAVVPAEGGSPRMLTPSLDRNVSAPQFSPDGRRIRFVLEDHGERHLASVDLEGGHLRRLVAGHRRVSGLAQGPDGLVVVPVSEPHLPTELFVRREDGLVRLTHTNDSLLAHRTLGAVRKIRFPSRDGTGIEGFMVTPPDYVPGRRYATLLRIHGGPVSQYDFGWNFEAQLFAANGYVVVLINPRGSSGYGQAFARAIWADWGHLDYEDVMAGVDYAIREGYADPDRLGVGGWSYGGILTDHVITRTDRFKAAITGASEVLYRSNYGHDHYQRQWEAELGLPWRNAEAWERISPFNRVDRIRTPTLIMGGEEDWNVPILNSEQLYQALRRLGRTTQLVVYPGEHHGIRTPSYQKDRLERYLRWYGRFVLGEREVSP